MDRSKYLSPWRKRGYWWIRQSLKCEVYPINCRGIVFQGEDDKYGISKPFIPKWVNYKGRVDTLEEAQNIVDIVLEKVGCIFLTQEKFDKLILLE